MELKRQTMAIPIATQDATLAAPGNVMQFSIQLAARIGINEAILLAGLHDLINAATTVTARGLAFARLTESALLAHFPFFSARTLRRVAMSLEAQHILFRDQNISVNRYDRTKWWAIDLAQVKALTSNEPSKVIRFEPRKDRSIAPSPDASVQSGHIDPARMADCLLTPSEAGHPPADDALPSPTVDVADPNILESDSSDSSDSLNPNPGIEEKGIGPLATTDGNTPKDANSMPPQTPPPGSELPPAPLNVGDTVYWLYAQRGGWNLTQSVPAMVLGFTKVKVRIAAKLEAGGFKVVLINPGKLKPRRRVGDPEPWEIEALTPATKKPKADKPVEPQALLTKALHEALPDDLRPARCHYAKQDADARAVLAAGWMAEQVGAYVRWLYATNTWYWTGNDGMPVIITMAAVSRNLNRAVWFKVEAWDKAQQAKQAAVPNGAAPASQEPITDPATLMRLANEGYRRLEERNRKLREGK